jgi:glycosyltransferase involved in cell wall biosynthesis
MHIALIAPPFIAVPPRRYGGTELFLANLARGLHAGGHEVTLYGNGDSRLPCRVKWIYEHDDWPIADEVRSQLKAADHAAWAVHDAAGTADVLHLNDAVGLPMTRFTDVPTVLTIHHPHEAPLSEQYERYAEVHYVAIAEWLARLEPMPRMSVVHHGIPARQYTWSPDKDDYVVFMGRMAPCKGPHLAIDAARQAGVRIRLAGEVQPQFHDYWTREVEPRIDGDRVVYEGEADFATKNALMSRAKALLFPIQWEEPFGLVLVEAMACGTPVLALRGGAVEEIVEDGVNGWICRDVDDMVRRLAELDIDPAACRDSVRARFSTEKMVQGYLEVYERALAASASARVEREV